MIVFDAEAEALSGELDANLNMHTRRKQSGYINASKAHHATQSVTTLCKYYAILGNP